MSTTNRKSIYEIIPDRLIVKMKNEEFAGIHYESWLVEPTIWCDQVEKLVENGYLVSLTSKGLIAVHSQITPTPEELRTNKQFWHNLMEAIQ